MTNRLRELKPFRRIDWDASYREGTPSWETGEPAAELVRLVREKVISSVSDPRIGLRHGGKRHLSRQGRLRDDGRGQLAHRPGAGSGRAEREDALLRLVFADAFEFGQTAGQFDLVFDVGLYHFIRHTDLERFLDLLWRTTRPGSHYLTIAAAEDEFARRQPAAVGPKADSSRVGAAVRDGRIARVPLGDRRRQGRLSGVVVPDARPVVGSRYAIRRAVPDSSLKSC